MNDTPDLFQPITLDVAGADLDATIQSLEARGALIQRMDVVGLSSYRLGIVWPQQIPRNRARKLLPAADPAGDWPFVPSAMRQDFRNLPSTQHR